MHALYSGHCPDSEDGGGEGETVEGIRGEKIRRVYVIFVYTDWN